MIKKIIIFTFLFFAALFNVSAQDSVMIEEVTVSKEYNPTVKDAFKISTTPEVALPEPYTPVFEYSFFNVPIKTEYQIQFIGADKFIPEKVTYDGKPNYVKGGGGNYSTLMGELFYNAYESDNQKVNFLYRNRSSWGDVMLQNNMKVDAPSISNYALVDYQHRFRNSILSSSFVFDRQSYKHYGYSTIDDNTTYSYANSDSVFLDEGKQLLNGIGFNLKYMSLPRVRSDFDYMLDFNYNTLFNEDNFSENQFTLKNNLTWKLDKINLGFDILANVGFYGKGNQEVARKYVGDTYFGANVAPFISFNKEIFDLKLGVKFDYYTEGGNHEFLPSPVVDFNVGIVPEYFNLFVKASGGIMQNTYADVMQINPYVANNIDRQATREILNSSVGIIWDSNMALSMRVSLNYKILKNQMFFVNEFVTDDSNVANNAAYTNRFVAEYDDNQLLNPHLEVSYNNQTCWSVSAAFDYYHNSLKNLPEAWNLLDYKISLFGHYDITEKIRTRATFFFLPARAVKVSTANAVDYTPFTYDLSLNGEYSFREYLSFFVDINNVLGSKYYTFNGYSTYRFNALAGAIFRF